MAANGRIDLAWADGDHAFNIARIGQVLELEEKCGSGVMEILHRLQEGRWKFHDVRETVRLGLIGGGMSPADALILTKRYVDERPWEESVRIAYAILLAAIVGVPGDIVGKKEEAERKKAAESSAPSSMASVPSSDGPLVKQTRSRSGSLPRRSTTITKRTEAVKTRPSA